ncbi:MAG: N-acetylglucosamine kinase [Flavobacterium sp.]|nr:N-acetylglucosamine kinase [Candidatus Neoflavobacterium equi]
MILIVDSGSTKADWIALNEESDVVLTTATKGMNPEVLSDEEFLDRAKSCPDLAQLKDRVKALYFYGSGCGSDLTKARVSGLLAGYFSNASIDVHEDTYAAVYATVQNQEPAVVCILGTGSNCSFFNGETIEQKIISLGYLAMDDAGGCQFGRLLLRNYFYNQMPMDLMVKFEKMFDLNPDVIKNNFYKQPNPNAYLAQFALFIVEERTHPFIQNLINEEMQRFIDLQIKQFDQADQVPIHFIGSLAHFLKEEIQRILESNNLKLGVIYKKPIDGLIYYHKV